jgi:hypothetical protein
MYRAPLPISIQPVDDDLSQSRAMAQIVILARIYHREELAIIVVLE